MMGIELIDIDSIIPNLALMKLSAHYKSQGQSISLNLHPPFPYIDYVSSNKKIASLVFEKNKHIADHFKNADIGGYFYDATKVLSPEIEHIMPDYSLYNGLVCKQCGHITDSCVCRASLPKKQLLKGNMWYSMGFTTRGCINHCAFCIVPKKEGMIRANADIYEFWHPSHKHIVLLDNNILALPDHFKKIAQQIKDNNLSVDFNQGLDCRLLNDENTRILSELNIKPEPRFAFDNPNDEKHVLRAVKLMEEHNIKRALWYVLVGFNTTWEQDWKRLMLLKDLKQRPYVMRHANLKGNKDYNLLASWVNQYKLFTSMDFAKFCELTDDRTKIHYRKKKHV